MSQKPFFVALEGIDGAGKDTAALALSAHFNWEHDLKIAVTEEPSKSQIGILIREMLDGKIPAPVSSRDFQILFMADRRVHIKSVIRPQIERERWVISVRYWLSTIAYGMLEASAAEYLELHSRVVGSGMIVPDLTVILDLEEDEAMRRIQKAGRKFDWFAKKEKLKKIRHNYLDLAGSGLTELGNVVIIDAMKSKEETALAAETAIEEYYFKKTLVGGDDAQG